MPINFWKPKNLLSKFSSGQIDSYEKFPVLYFFIKYTYDKSPHKLLFIFEVINEL